MIKYEEIEYWGGDSMFEKTIENELGELRGKTCTCSSCECTGSGAAGNTAANGSASSSTSTVKGNSK